jgi:hypothetical protein
MAVTNVTRVQGLVFGLGVHKQAAASTISADFVRWRKLDMKVPFDLYHTENDAHEVGKGNEFATAVYNTSVEPSAMTIEKYGSAEFTTWAWAYALGVVGGTPASGIYTIVPIDPGTNLEPPYFSVVSIVPSAGGYAVALSQIGCGIESVETTFHYGPGRASVSTRAEYMGLGYNNGTSPYTTVPALQSENYMYASSLTMTLVSGATTINYVSNKAILHGTMGWKNNFNGAMRYLPGSGFDAYGFQTGDRLLIGTRVPTLTFTVFLDQNSAEYAALQAQSTWDVTIKLNIDSAHNVQWAYTTANFNMVETTQEDGFVAVTCTMDPLYGSTATATGGGLTNFITVTANCGLNNIAQ